ISRATGCTTVTFGGGGAGGVPALQPITRRSDAMTTTAAARAGRPIGREASVFRMMVCLFTYPRSGDTCPHSLRRERAGGGRPPGKNAPPRRPGSGRARGPTRSLRRRDRLHGRDATVDELHALTELVVVVVEPVVRVGARRAVCRRIAAGGDGLPLR